MKKIRRDAFADSHPIVNLIYFIFVIGFAMMSLHPVSLGIAFLGAVSYSICLNGRRALYQNLRYMLPVVILTALINPVFSHQGVTILRYLPSGNPLTLESILYGIAAAVMLVTVLCWFSSFNRIMTSDKMIYLFGRLAPYLSIVLSMTLKFLPEFTASRKQQKQHQSQRQRNHSPQTGIRTMLVLELSGPFQMHGIMIVFHLFINQRIRMIQERRQVHAT